MSNYINTLESALAVSMAEQGARIRGVIRFRAHLSGTKFMDDPTIQVGDVDSWLLMINAEITEAGDAARRLMSSGFMALATVSGDLTARRDPRASQLTWIATHSQRGRWADLGVALQALGEDAYDALVPEDIQSDIHAVLGDVYLDVFMP